MLIAVAIHLILLSRTRTVRSLFLNGHLPFVPLVMALLSWLRIPGSSYAVTRPITLRYFNVLFIVLGLIYLVFITLINVVAVGYESIPAFSPLYLHTEKLWYENLLPHNAALPHTWNCNASVIKVNEGSSARKQSLMNSVGHMESSIPRLSTCVLYGFK